MQRPSNLRVGDKFVVGLNSDGRPHHTFKFGEVVTLRYDDETDCPKFGNGIELHYIDFDRLTPFVQAILDVKHLLHIDRWSVEVDGQEEFETLWKALVEAGFRVTPHKGELRASKFIKFNKTALGYIWASNNSDGCAFKYEDLLVSNQGVPAMTLTIEDCYKIVEADQRLGCAQAELDNAKEIVENLLHELNALKAKHNIK